VTRRTIEDVTNHYQATFESYGAALAALGDAEFELDSKFEVHVVCPAFENWRQEYLCETDDEIDAATQPDWYESENQDVFLQRERTRERMAIRQSLKEQLAARRLDRRAAEERLKIDELRRRADAAEVAERESRMALIIYSPADEREAAIKREFVISSVFFKDSWCQEDRGDFIAPLLLALCDVPANAQ